MFGGDAYLNLYTQIKLGYIEWLKEHRIKKKFRKIYIERESQEEPVTSLPKISWYWRWQFYN